MLRISSLEWKYNILIKKCVFFYIKKCCIASWSYIFKLLENWSCNQSSTPSALEIFLGPFLLLYYSSSFWRSSDNIFIPLFSANLLLPTIYPLLNLWSFPRHIYFKLVTPYFLDEAPGLELTSSRIRPPCFFSPVLNKPSSIKPPPSNKPPTLP